MLVPIQIFVKKHSKDFDVIDYRYNYIVEFNFWFGCFFIFLDLIGENLKPLILLQSFMISTLSWIFSRMDLLFLLLQCKLISSANKLICVGSFVILVTSLIAIKKRVTLMGEPCSTPLSGVNFSENVLLTFTMKDLSDKKCYMYACMLLWIPVNFLLYHLLYTPQDHWYISTHQTLSKWPRFSIK